MKHLLVIVVSSILLTACAGKPPSGAQKIYVHGDPPVVAAMDPQTGDIETYGDPKDALRHALRAFVQQSQAMQQKIAELDSKLNPRPTPPTPKAEEPAKTPVDKGVSPPKTDEKPEKKAGLEPKKEATPEGKQEAKKEPGKLEILPSGNKQAESKNGK